LDRDVNRHPPQDPLVPLYNLYGVTFAAPFPLAAPLPAGRRAAQLTVSSGPDTPPGDWGVGDPLYVDAPAAAPGLTLFRGARGMRLHFPRAGDFYVAESTIHFRPAAGGDPVLAENFLIGSVFSLCLERRNVPVLHASVCAVDGGAVAFLATSRSGKSSLAAELLRAGAALLSDDLLALELSEGVWRALPGYPQMRLWPEQAARYLCEASHLPPVHPLAEKLRAPVGEGFGRFQPDALPLRAIYLPERRDASDDGVSAVTFEALSPSAGLMELVRHSFLNRLVHAAGLQPRRLPLLANVAGAVPIRRVSFPSGMERLPSVAQAILDDLRERAPR
jgi:hypothetical protein